MKRFPLLMSLFVLSVAGTSCSSVSYLKNVDEELSQELAKSGSAIAWIGGSRITVTSLNGSPDVVYCLREIPFGFALLSHDGRKIVERRMFGISVYDLATDNLESFHMSVASSCYWADLSKDGKVLALLTTGLERSGQLTIVDLSGRPTVSAVLKISSAATANTLAWSPDGKSIVYEAGGSIEIYSLPLKRSRTIGPGLHPSWSGDGAWIGYQSIEGEPILYHVIDGKEMRLLGKRKILWSLHFSPDSRYFFFSERSLSTLLRSPGRLSEVSLVICDVAGFREVARFTTPGGLDDTFYGWVCLNPPIQLPKCPTK